ncbi:hypothetical protein [Oecophyllibacter saccharovorans]|uniref:hypothetical protein n=1 Tax=Oecophyllibacter saccharovorans TaxID=2558360 RepID=UPI001F4FF331|nr:hypothetical protein [Oecophyllibacter saccharovorans]
MCFPARSSAICPTFRLTSFLVPVLAVLGLSLSGCSVGHPFADPGEEATRLALGSLPPPRLAVMVPQVPTGKAAGLLWEKDMVVALVGQSVPAVGRMPARGDWAVQLGVKPVDGGVIPQYTLVDGSGQKRGSGEGSEIDEAAWQSGNAEALNLAALQMAPKLAQQLTTIELHAMEEDPHSLHNRPARIYFSGVKGAPGDGDAALGKAFVNFLNDARDQVQSSPKKADFSVGCTVKLGRVEPGQHGAPPQQQITIIWRVLTAKGVEAGAATQLHEIPAHSLDGKWGDTAIEAAQEAADATKTIISNYSRRNQTTTPSGASKP